ncbi:MAG: hypothetical protein ACK4YQ_16885 [Phenylobacterium sp.]|uniref:hypothetical protein n=1 Tax=Phenylobacterium sp. TaxID=1871053 RepID=UPI00391CF5F6
MTGVAAIVRHRFDPRSPTVTLRVQPEGASIYEDYRLTHAEARRLAWALLADLCPDDLDDDLERAAELLAATGSPSAAGLVCSCAKAPRAPTGFAATILRALGTRNITAREAGELIDRSTSIASNFILTLVNRGLAVKVSGGLFGEPSVYAITPAGRSALDRGTI